MIGDVDEALRQLLIQELPIKDNQVEVKFDQPNRDWSARVSQPTLNIYLYDVRENKALRQTRPMWERFEDENGNMVQRRRPVRMDLHYMVTAWATEAEDEHQLLSGALMALLRYANLPEEILPTRLREQPVPIPIMIAQYDEMRNPSDVWSALDNEVRPSVVCIITLSVNPYAAIPLAPGIKEPPIIQTDQMSEKAR